MPVHYFNQGSGDYQLEPFNKTEPAAFFIEGEDKEHHQPSSEISATPVWFTPSQLQVILHSWHVISGGAGMYIME